MDNRIHFMGILGSGAKGVAALANKMGYQVTGCDLELEGHDARHLENVDLLVVSPAVFYQNKKHPELLEGEKRKIVMTWQEFLGKILLKDKKVIAVAGTHGKSTTTAMVGKLLIDNGFDPIVVLGAQVGDWKGSSRYGKGEWAVVEADEFYDNFLNFSPEIAIITNIEFDHPDFFNDEKTIKKSFSKFVAQSKKVITKGKAIDIQLKILGEHNKHNASLVAKLGEELKIPASKIKESLESFSGIGRRLERLGETKSGAIIFDDYAHHPTAIKTTLEGLRKEYPKKKILAIIEPHGYKRTGSLMSKYKGVFNTVDGVIIGPIFRSRDMIDESISTQKLANVSRHSNISTASNQEEIIERWKLESENYDIVVVMGAGKSNLWAKKLLAS